MHLYLPWTSLTPLRHCWGCSPGRVSTLATSVAPLISLSPGEKLKLSQGTHCLMLEVPGELEEPQPSSERWATPHSPCRCHQRASRKGRAWEYVSPGRWMGEFTPLSALIHREAASFTAQQSPGFTGAGISASWDGCPRALSAGQAGLELGHNPKTAQTLGGEELRPASSRNNLSQGGKHPVSLLRPRPRPPLFPPLFSLWFFPLSGGSL